MPRDKLIFETHLGSDKYPSVRLVSRDKVKRGEKEYHYFEVSYHHGRKEWGADVEYDVPEVFRPGTRWARPTVGSYGGFECFAKTIPDVLDCLKQRFDVDIEVRGDMKEIDRMAQLVLEEAVAPKPQEIGLFEVIESNSEQVLEGMKKDLGRFCTQAGVGRHVGEAGREFAAKACKEVLEWLAGDIDLEVSNEDWSSDLKYGDNTFARGAVSESTGRLVVRKKLAEILHRDREGAEYWAEQTWGVLPREPYNMKEKDRAERFAEQLHDIFKASEREFLNSIGDETARKLESDRLKDAVKLFLSTYLASMKRRVEQLR